MTTIPSTAIPPPALQAVLPAVRAPLAWWLLLLAVGLAARPPLPVDETRYLAVAWEMWSRGDLLVPHLLGEPYHHKPPLLFWCMHLGWWVFGVSEWWARVVAPLFALATVLLTARTAAWWWPAQPGVARLAPWLLVGTLFWSVFATLTMFDLLVSACALAGAWGLALAARDRRRGGFLLTGVAIGVGILAKGPVILLHVLPLALAAPWWAGLPLARWPRWYAGCMLAVLGGAALAVCWALPAALTGGEAYTQAIFWNQSAGRMAGAADHGVNGHHHSWWWLLPFLPALLFPWAVWPPAWRALRRLPAHGRDVGVRWCLCWCGAALLLHSVISGKQPHYLIPLVPPAMLLLAHALAAVEVPVRRRDHWPLSVVLALISAVLLVGPLLDRSTLAWLAWGNREAAPQEWGAAIGLLPGVLVAALSVAFIALPAASLPAAVRRVTVTGILLLVILHLGAAPAIRPAYDLGPLAQRIGAWQAQGIPVARIGKDHGEFQFTGRLTAPLAELELSDVVTWTRDHPTGMLLMTYKPSRGLPRGIARPAEDRAYRGVRLGVWQAAHMVLETEDD